MNWDLLYYFLSIISVCIISIFCIVYLLYFFKILKYEVLEYLYFNVRIELSEILKDSDKFKQELISELLRELKVGNNFELLSYNKEEKTTFGSTTIITFSFRVLLNEVSLMENKAKIMENFQSITLKDLQTKYYTQKIFLQRDKTVQRYIKTKYELELDYSSLLQKTGYFIYDLTKSFPRLKYNNFFEDLKYTTKENEPNVSIYKYDEIFELVQVKNIDGTFNYYLSGIITDINRKYIIELQSEGVEFYITLFNSSAEMITSFT